MIARRARRCTRRGRAVARAARLRARRAAGLRDPDGELGLGAQERGYLTLSGGASSTWTSPLGRHRATAGVELRGDRFRDADRGGDAARARRRSRGRRGARRDRSRARMPTIVVTPALRLDVVRTAPTPMTPDRGRVPVRAALGHRPEPADDRARARSTTTSRSRRARGYYVRLPTLLELFGNRGTIVGSPELRPERGPSLDAGVVWAPANALGPVDRVFVEASAFGTRSRDTIALVSSVGYVARAHEHRRRADLRRGARRIGAVRAHVSRHRELHAPGHRAASRADQLDADKALPRQPGARCLRARRCRAPLAATATSAVARRAAGRPRAYLDQANLQRVPARLLVGAGARVEIAGSPRVALSVENLADTRIAALRSIRRRARSHRYPDCALRPRRVSATRPQLLSRLDWTH